MPKRWLSRLERSRDHDSSAQNTSSNNGQDFDFAFPNPAAGLPPSAPTITALPSTSAKDERHPTQAEFDDGRPKKNLAIQVPRVRPRSSDGDRGSALFRSHRQSRSLDGLIGLAFGSPGHPPMAFSSLAEPLHPMQPLEPDPTPRPRGHFGLGSKGPHLQPIKWKKIGAMIRGRSAFTKAKDSSTATNPVPLPHNEDQKHSDERPLPRNPGTKSKPLPLEQPVRIPPFAPKPEIELSSGCAGKSVLLEPTPPSSAGPPLPHKQLVQRPTRISSLPRLEVEIPSPSPDQSTVIMSNLPAASQSSSLLARRTKAVEGLSTSATSSRSASTPDAEQTNVGGRTLAEKRSELFPLRRMTSPTMPKPPFAIVKPEYSPTVSKYSLFPSQSPAPIKIVGRIPVDGTLKRSATSPARLSPMQEHFVSSSKSQPLVKPILEEHPLSSTTDRTDGSSTGHSLQSSMSSSTTMEEIFFDIKSFRDSRGVEDGQQFVINRPDSTVVHLARTRSKLNAASRTHKQSNEPLPSTTKQASSSLRKELLDKHASVNTVTSAVFDEVIAAVEELATPISARERKEAENLGSNNEVQRGATKPSLVRAELEKKLLPPDPVLPFRSTRDQVGRMIPSPVPEEVSPHSKKTGVAEKGLETRPVSPLSFVSEHPIALKRDSTSSSPQSGPARAVEQSPSQEKALRPEDGPRPGAVAAVAAITAIKRADTPIEDSPTIPQGPPPRKPLPIQRDDDDEKPPPVPKKDTKYIPISKFAARNAVSKVEQVGFRPARPTRAATDTVIMSSPKVAQNEKHQSRTVGRSERSATVPNRQSQQQRTSTQPSRSDFAHRAKAENGGRGEVTTLAAVVRAPPAAEVSVARTISLSRKQSARVLVPGPKLASRRAADRQNQSGTESGTATPSTVISAANSPAIGTDSPRPTQDHIKPKIVDVQPSVREVTVRPNPLRSHPSPPSMVLTEAPSPAIGSNTGKVTLPPAPTRPAPGDPDKEKAREKIKALKEQAREKIATATANAEAAAAREVESRQSNRSSVKVGDEEQKEKDRQMIEKYKDKDKTKWDLLEKLALSPVLMEGERRFGHKQGLSVGVVFEGA